MALSSEKRRAPKRGLSVTMVSVRCRWWSRWPAKQEKEPLCTFKQIYIHVLMCTPFLSWRQLTGNTAGHLPLLASISLDKMSWRSSHVSVWRALFFWNHSAYWFHSAMCPSAFSLSWIHRHSSYFLSSVIVQNVAAKVLLGQGVGGRVFVSRLEGGLLQSGWTIFTFHLSPTAQSPRVLSHYHHGPSTLRNGPGTTIYTLVWIGVCGLQEDLCVEHYLKSMKEWYCYTFSYTKPH